MDSTYTTLTLANGLRLIHLPSTSPVVYCGYQIATGTRHEQPGEEGLAHFVEHTTFKGTSRRTSLQVINELEVVGGELNAYTNKEATVYYAAVLQEHLPLAADLLTDLVFHAVYPAEEVEKEKEVVIEEIESYHDSPAELIYDEFDNLLFSEHPLGHNILGSIDTVKGFSDADALQFARRHYRPDNAVFFLYGGPTPGSPAAAPLLAILESTPACLPPKADTTARQDSPTAAPHRQPTSVTHLQANGTPTPQTVESHRHTHQAHVMMGCRAYAWQHPDRMALSLLTNILGGPGLNARLSLTLREQYGLVYTVESTQACYRDTGSWSIYFGCDHNDVEACIKLTREEIEKWIKKPISPQKLAQAKTQMKGQITIAGDHREGFALDFGKAFLYDGKPKDLQQVCRDIDAVTAEQLQRVAREIMEPSRMLTLIYR